MGRFIVCVSSLIALLSAGSAQAADRNWTGAGADDLWSTAANWDTGVPGPGDNGLINTGTALIDSTVTAILARVNISTAGTGTLTMTGGTLSQSGKYPLTVGSKPGGVGTFNLSGGEVFSGDGFLISNSAGSVGIVNMSGGTINSQATYSPSGWWSMFGIGDAGTGTLNMSGGAITANVMKIPSRSGTGTLNMTGGTIDVAGGLYVNASGDVHLDGGVVSAADLFMNAAGRLDITEGMLILAGDDRTVLEGYINSGLITGYGGEGDLAIGYDAANNITTVTATAYISVSNPVPANRADRVSLTPTLSWDPPNPLRLADPNHPEDVEYIVYFDPNESLVANGDSSVAVQQAETEFSPSSALDPGRSYYWRVDVVDPNFGTPVVYPGAVWTFTTIPPKAGIVFPEDGATEVAQNAVLQWNPGIGAVAHILYFDTDETLVMNGDPSAYKGELTGVLFDPDLDWNTTYYWRVDEVFAAGDSVAGDVWSFTTGTPVCEYELEGDIDKNCVVNLEDFARMAANWLVCNLTNGDCP